MLKMPKVKIRHSLFKDDLALFLVIHLIFLDVFMDDKLCEGLRVGHGFDGEDLTLGQRRRGEGFTLSRGGMVNGKLEAHIFLPCFLLLNNRKSLFFLCFSNISSTSRVERGG